MICLGELTEHVDDELKEFFESKNQYQYVSCPDEMFEVTQNHNSTKLAEVCRLKKGEDYIVVLLDKHPKTIRRMVELGLNKSLHSNKGTLYLESAIWKILLNSKTDLGIAFKDLLSKCVLPSLRYTVRKKLDVKEFINLIK